MSDEPIPETVTIISGSLDDAAALARLTDGADALQRALRAALPDYPLVLDIIHALEHLWEAANGFLGERHPERTAWVRTRLDPLLHGQALAVAADLRTLAAAPTTSPPPATPPG